MLFLLGAELPPWPAQFGSGATVLIGGLWFIRWLLKRLEATEADLKAVNARMIDDIAPALSRSTDVMAKQTDVIILATQALDRLRESELRQQGRDGR